MRSLLLGCVSLSTLFCHMDFTEIQAFEWNDHREKMALAPAVLLLSPKSTEAGFYLLNGNEQIQQDFYSLVLTQEDGRHIHFIIKSMAKSGWFTLLKKKSELEQSGDSISHVHPLRFLGYIFSDPQRKHYMHLIKKSSIKWSRFKGGLFPNLKKEFEQGQLYPYLSEFAKVVDVEKKLLAHYIQNQDWEGFLNALM